MAQEPPHLTFVGVGPRGADGVTPAAVREVVLAGKVFAETYTAIFPEDALAFFSKTRKDGIPKLGRAEVEEGTAILEAAAAPGGAVLLVPGDPMAATTHVSLRIAAEQRGIPTRLIFAPSILHTAFSEAGLQHYNAGRTVTVPYPDKGFAPTSHLEKLEANQKAGVHTLALLDVRAAEGRYMTANEGFAALLEAARRLGRPVVSQDSLAVVIARAGEVDCLRRAGAVRRLQKMDFGRPMHALIFPGALHFEEREALKVLCGAKEKEMPPER